MICSCPQLQEASRLIIGVAFRLSAEIVVTAVLLTDIGSFFVQRTEECTVPAIPHDHPRQAGACCVGFDAMPAFVRMTLGFRRDEALIPRCALVRSYFGL